MSVLTPLHAGLTMSVSELKKNPMAVVKEAKGRAVAVLNRNSPAFYCVPPDMYEAMLDAIEDRKLAEIIHQRRHEQGAPISLEELERL